jgi:UDP-glucose:glycoprotein glucosyltransferase
MAKTTDRFATKAAVVIGLVLGANAVPSVNVALKTSFGAPPYLIELLLVLPFAVRPDIL